MTRQDELLRLSDLIANTTAAHEAVLSAPSGSQSKVAAIRVRAQTLDELEQFANSVPDNEVSDKAFAAHDGLATVVNDAAIADILGAANVLDGFVDAFHSAADKAEKLQVLTDRWATIAEQAAQNAASIIQNARDAATQVSTQLAEIRAALA